MKGSTPEFARAAHDTDKVFSAKFPLTGVMGPMQEVMPGGKYLGPAWAHLSNTVPSLKAHALGTGRLPMVLRAPVALTEGAGMAADAASRDPSRDALIRALLRAKASEMPVDALASEE